MYICIYVYVRSMRVLRKLHSCSFLLLELLPNAINSLSPLCCRVPLLEKSIITLKLFPGTRCKRQKIPLPASSPIHSQFSSVHSRPHQFFFVVTVKRRITSGERVRTARTVLSLFEEGRPLFGDARGFSPTERIPLFLFLLLREKIAESIYYTIRIYQTVLFSQLRPVRILIRPNGDH